MTTQVTQTQPQDVPTRPKLGVAFVPTMPPDSLPGLARAAEDAGLDELWVWEDCFTHGGLTSAAIALACTERITVGIGLLPAPLRSVAITAMEVSTVAGAFPGRLIVGVGHGVQPWMAQAGVKADSPMTLLREYATALGALLAGDEVTAEGRYVRLDKVQLDWPPTPRPQVMMGGFGPKTLELSGELGDGILLASGMSPVKVREADELSRASADGKPLVASTIITTGEGAAERLERELTLWTNSPDPDVGVAGGVDEIAAYVDELAAAGATSVIWQPTQDEPDRDGLLQMLGGPVRGRLATN